ncbi:hypothetical protein BC835DRAFT_1356742 [Cytidiella melzeri]|nr:hypothetical protein BC835DRAFT_1356742 [Cytidiella melzeri]
MTTTLSGLLPDALVALNTVKAPSRHPATTTTMSYADDSILPGDIVAVQHGQYGRTEGLVVGSHVDLQGRQIVEVQLDRRDSEVYHAWLPSVTRVRRTTYYSAPPPQKVRTVERRVYW